MAINQNKSYERRTVKTNKKKTEPLKRIIFFNFGWPNQIFVLFSTVENRSKAPNKP